MKAHPFHIVTPSPWPLLSSLALMATLMTLALWMHGYAPSNLFGLELVVLAGSMLLWFRDICTEGLYMGDHLTAVKQGLNMGFVLFALTECLVFAGLFWAYLHSAMNPAVELGLAWAPLDIAKVGAMDLPLLNTVILLSSGATVTYSHHAWIAGARKGAIYSMVVLWALIVIFVALQFVEYTLAAFTISDGVYGSVFYAGTGLHMFHMITLALMLAVVAVRMVTNKMEASSSLNLDTLIIYSHVLDVIWLALYVVFYVWE